MNEDAKKLMYQTIDSLSNAERQQLIAYLDVSRQQHRLCDIVTQEELDMLYAASLDIATQSQSKKKH